MLTATQIGGFVGAGLAGVAYVPQISHLVRARCSAGISRLAFGVWLLASLLITAHAVATHAAVFIVLGGIQIVATAFIMLCAARYQDTPCPLHLPRQPTAQTAPQSSAVTDRPGREADVQAVRGWPGPGTAAVVPCADVARPGGAGRAPDFKRRAWAGRHHCISWRYHGCG